MWGDRDTGYTAALPSQGNYPAKTEHLFCYSVQTDGKTGELKLCLEGNPSIQKSLEPQSEILQN